MTDLNEAIASMIIETLELEQLKASDIGADDLLFGDEGLGLDSVDALELVVEIERRFGFQLQEDAASREVLKSVASMATWIQQQQAAVSPAG